MSKENIEIEAIETPEVEQKVKSQLPEPKGWKILVAMPQADEKTDGGIIKASQTIKDEEVSNQTHIKIKLGLRVELGVKKAIGLFSELTQVLA